MQKAKSPLLSRLCNDLLLKICSFLLPDSLAALACVSVKLRALTSLSLQGAPSDGLKQLTRIRIDAEKLPPQFRLPPKLSSLELSMSTASPTLCTVCTGVGHTLRSLELDAPMSINAILSALQHCSRLTFLRIISFASHEAETPFTGTLPSLRTLFLTAQLDPDVFDSVVCAVPGLTSLSAPYHCFTPRISELQYLTELADSAVLDFPPPVSLEAVANCRSLRKLTTAAAIKADPRFVIASVAELVTEFPAESICGCFPHLQRLQVENLDERPSPVQLEWDFIAFPTLESLSLDLSYSDDEAIQLQRLRDLALALVERELIPNLMVLHLVVTCEVESVLAPVRVARPSLQIKLDICEPSPFEEAISYLVRSEDM